MGLVGYYGMRLYIERKFIRAPHDPSRTPTYCIIPSVRFLIHPLITASCIHEPRRAMLILQPSRHFTYVTAHSPTLPSLYLRHSSFSNSSVASPTSQLILQPFFRFSYVTGSSPDEPPMTLLFYPINFKVR